MQFQLFLGRNIPDAGTISWAMIVEFLKTEVETRFDSYTMMQATGFWKGEPEKTVILTFITEDRESVEEIAQAFKTQFRQGSVLLTETALPVCQFV